MKKYLIIFLFLLCGICGGNLHAQMSRAYLIPGNIYVGDPAALVLPLPATQWIEDITLTRSNSFISDSRFPASEHIEFQRIILERRPTGSRLIIEFTPFAAGSLEMPVIDIGGEHFSGLRVTVNSLLDGRNAPVLSQAASVLAMPGTAILLYGAMAAIVLIILSVVWFVFKGRTAIIRWKEKWKKRMLFASIRGTLKRLYRALYRGMDIRRILDRLSDDFRGFLSILTGDNCRAMTAREFERTFEHLEDSLFLGSFFTRCDRMRFSGIPVEHEDVMRLLDDMRSFINLKSREEKSK